MVKYHSNVRSMSVYLWFISLTESRETTIMDGDYCKKQSDIKYSASAGFGFENYFIEV